MNTVFIDMDGPLVDFDAYKRATGLTSEEVKRSRGSYIAMPETPGGVAAVHSILGMGYKVFLATKPPTGIPWAYADKVQWVLDHLPELKRNIILTHDKGLLGDARDFLIDDRLHKANCAAFSGTLIGFVTRQKAEWRSILRMLSEHSQNNNKKSGA